MTRATPVLLLAHKRPQHTREVLESIRASTPRELYVSCDGPRDPSEVHRVKEVHKLIRDLDWPTRVRTRFLRKNLGSRIAVTTALDWFFTQEPRGIILEDDCVAAPDFFWLADAFLDHHEKDRGVWGLTGSNTANLDFRGLYAFIRQPLTWGWATWADRWKKRDAQLNQYRTERSNVDAWLSPDHKSAYRRHLDRMLFEGKPDAWDYMWAWTVMANRGLWAVPSQNLVANIGDGPGASNTHPRRWIRTRLGSADRNLFPSPVVVNKRADDLVLRRIHGLVRPLWLNEIVNAIRALRDGLKKRVSRQS